MYILLQDDYFTVCQCDCNLINNPQISLFYEKYLIDNYNGINSHI